MEIDENLERFLTYVKIDTQSDDISNSTPSAMKELDLARQLMKELDELDKQKALYQLMSKLNEAEISIREEGTISADDLEKELGV